MTKKDYELIARVLTNAASTGNARKVAQIAVMLADEFEQQNPAFDRPKFMQACGLPWIG